MKITGSVLSSHLRPFLVRELQAARVKSSFERDGHELVLATGTEMIDSAVSSHLRPRFFRALAT